MQKPLSFERLQKDMPETVAKVVARARESRSRRFDASTDPSTWTWLLDWSERTPDALPDPVADRSDEQRWDDLRADGAEAYVRERIRRNGLMPSLRLKTGPTSILEMITADGELPSEWVDTFGLKTYAPLPWDGDTLTLYQPFNTERPGLAQAAVLAGFTTSAGATVLLMAEGHLDRTMDTLWSVTLQPSRQLAIVGGTQPRQNGEWDVPVGEVITVEDEKWRRLDANEVRQAIGSAPWLRQDSTAARDAMAMLGWPVTTARRGTSAPAMNELPADAPVWAVGAARSDEEVLRDKWAPAPVTAPSTPAASSATPMAAATTPGTGTGPAQPSGKKTTTVAGSVRTNDPDALREALTASKSSGYQLSAEQLSALLLNAAEKAGTEVMSILIEHGADPTYRTRQGMTLTSTVVRHERIDNLTWLHENGYANLREDDGNGNTLLMTAVESHRFVGAQALLDLGADINGTNLFNHSALHQAAQTGNGEAVKWLIEHLADPNRENFQGVIAEEMVPNELPEMVDVLADYRFAWDKGETYTLPGNFLESLRNESQHPSMKPDGDASGGMGLGGGMGVQISGLEGVTVMSGDDFQRVLGQHGAEGLVAAGQDGTLGAILGAAGARTMGPGEHTLPLRGMGDHDGGEDGAAPNGTVNPADFLFAYVGHGQIVGVVAHLVAITPKALWDAEACMDDQPHPELESVLPRAWQPEDLNEGGSWAFVTPETPEQVVARLKALGFQEDRVFSAMVRATVDAPEPLDGDLDEPDDAPQAPTPPRPRMR